MATFDIHSDRINVVLGKLMQSRTHLWEAAKLWLILSHGNIDVESGFSTNEQILDHNMKETSLVAQCCHTMYCLRRYSNERVALKVDINKKLLSYVRGAHAEYSRALKDNKKTQMAGEKQKQEQRRLIRS